MRLKDIACATVAAWLACGTVAFADEVTKSTTTTTTKTDPTVVVTPAPGPAVVGDDVGCGTKKVTKTDGETGDTVKKTTSNCD